MAYVSSTYKNNPSAPIDKNVWVGDRQCVAYVEFVTPGLPRSGSWTKGGPVKGDKTIAAGTVIATFNAHGHYQGHAAIYEDQDALGIDVVDQWVTPPPMPIHRRKLRFGAHGNSNNGDNFYVVE